MEKSKNKVSAKETQHLGNTVAVGVDGSDGSSNALELVVEDFHRKGLDKIIVIHITNEKKDHEKGVQYHSKSVYNKHHEYLKSHLNENDYEFVFEEQTENVGVFEQINNIAESKKADLLVFGFRGVNGSKNRPDELSKGIKYLVHKPAIPCLVVKEKTHRSYRKEGGFKWLVCIESAESKSFKAFTHCLRLVDAENDIIHGFSVDMNDGKSKKVEELFNEQCKKNEIKNFNFDTVSLGDKKVVKDVIHSWITEHLKNENHFLDFVVMGYNSSKYNFNREAENTTVDLLKDVLCNVFFDH